MSEEGTDVQPFLWLVRPMDGAWVSQEHPQVVWAKDSSAARIKIGAALAASAPSASLDDVEVVVRPF